MSENRNDQSVRRIVLPSGRTIEIFRFHEVDEAPRRPLHLCPDCTSELVQPVAWAEASESRWELLLSCPNCWRETEGVFDEAQVLALEKRLDEGLAEMLRDLQRLTQANMADQLERFAAALQADLILPEDF